MSNLKSTYYVQSLVDMTQRQHNPRSIEEYKRLNDIYAITLDTDNGNLLLLENGRSIGYTVIARYDDSISTEDIWNDVLDVGILLGVEVRITESAQFKLNQLSQGNK